MKWYEGVWSALPGGAWQSFPAAWKPPLLKNPVSFILSSAQRCGFTHNDLVAGNRRQQADYPTKRLND